MLDFKSPLKVFKLQVLPFSAVLDAHFIFPVNCCRLRQSFLDVFFFSVRRNLSYFFSTNFPAHSTLPEQGMKFVNFITTVYMIHVYITDDFDHTN